MKNAVERVDDRDRPYWRYCLHHFYTSDRKLSDASFDEYQTSSIPVASMIYLKQYMSTTSNIKSPASLFVSLISIYSEIQLILLVLLPFLSTSYVPSSIEHLIATIALGISMDFRSPWLVFLIITMCCLVLLVLVLCLVVSMYILVFLRSPLSRRTYEVMCALECAHLHTDTVKGQLHVVPRPLSLIHELLFKYTPQIHDLIESIGNSAVFVSGSLWSFLW